MVPHCCCKAVGSHLIRGPCTSVSYNNAAEGATDESLSKGPKMRYVRHTSVRALTVRHGYLTLLRYLFQMAHSAFGEVYGHRCLHLAQAPSDLIATVACQLLPDWSDGMLLLARFWDAWAGVAVGIRL